MLSLMTQAFLLFEEATPAAEEETSGVDLLLPDPNEAIAGIIAFAIVFFFVWKWAVPALNKTLEARQQAIRSELQAAEDAKVEAESLLGDYQDQLSGAKAEAAQIVDDARTSGEQVKADVVARAETEADQIKDAGPGRDRGRTRTCCRGAPAPGRGSIDRCRREGCRQQPRRRTVSASLSTATSMTSEECTR